MSYLLNSKFHSIKPVLTQEKLSVNVQEKAELQTRNLQGKLYQHMNRRVLKGSSVQLAAKRSFQVDQQDNLDSKKQFLLYSTQYEKPPSKRAHLLRKKNMTWGQNSSSPTLQPPRASKQLTSSSGNPNLPYSRGSLPATQTQENDVLSLHRISITNQHMQTQHQLHPMNPYNSQTFQTQQQTGKQSIEEEWNCLLQQNPIVKKHFQTRNSSKPLQGGGSIKRLGTSFGRTAVPNDLGKFVEPRKKKSRPASSYIGASSGNGLPMRNQESQPPSQIQIYPPQQGRQRRMKPCRPASAYLNSSIAKSGSQIDLVSQSAATQNVRLTSNTRKSQKNMSTSFNNARESSNTWFYDPEAPLKNLQIVGNPIPKQPVSTFSQTAFDSAQITNTRQKNKNKKGGQHLCSDERYDYLRTNGINGGKYGFAQEIACVELPDSNFGVPRLCRSLKLKDQSSHEKLRISNRLFTLNQFPIFEEEALAKNCEISNNRIKKIQHMTNLPNLCYLNLSNNQISKIQDIHLLKNLRVLILSNNKIRKIEGLENSWRLQVLDLSVNRIHNMEGLQNQVNLRSLNLSSNLIFEAGNLDSLGNLTQLYLQNNTVSSLKRLGKCVKLQVLDISMNMLSMLNDLDPLRELSALRRIALFGNPVCKIRGYGSYVTKTLDFLQRIDNIEKIQFEKHSLRILQPVVDSFEGEYEQVTPQEPIMSKESKILEIHEKWLAGVQNENDDGYYEQGPENTELRIFGNALKVLDEVDITFYRKISFNYISLSGILDKLSSIDCEQTFKEPWQTLQIQMNYNDISDFRQIATLRKWAIGRLLMKDKYDGDPKFELCIENNPVCRHVLFRPYMIRLFHHSCNLENFYSQHIRRYFLEPNLDLPQRKMIEAGRQLPPDGLVVDDEIPEPNENEMYEEIEYQICDARYKNDVRLQNRHRCFLVELLKKGNSKPISQEDNDEQKKKIYQVKNRVDQTTSEEDYINQISQFDYIMDKKDPNFLLHLKENPQEQKDKEPQTTPVCVFKHPLQAVQGTMSMFCHCCEATYSFAGQFYQCKTCLHNYCDHCGNKMNDEFVIRMEYQKILKQRQTVIIDKQHVDSSEPSDFSYLRISNLNHKLNVILYDTELVDVCNLYSIQIEPYAHEDKLFTPLDGDILLDGDLKLTSNFSYNFFVPKTGILYKVKELNQLFNLLGSKNLEEEFDKKLKNIRKVHTQSSDYAERKPAAFREHPSYINEFVFVNSIKLKMAKMVTKQVLYGIEGIIFEEQKLRYSTQQVYARHNRKEVIPKTTNIAQLDTEDLFEFKIQGLYSYMAPEQFKGKFSSQTYIWQLGCLLIQLCTGLKPYHSINEDKEAIKLIMVDFQTPLDHLVENQTNSSQIILQNPNVRTLLQQMFNFNILKRPTAAELLENPFFSEEGGKVVQIIQSKAIFDIYALNPSEMARKNVLEEGRRRIAEEAEAERQKLQREKEAFLKFIRCCGIYPHPDMYESQFGNQVNQGFQTYHNFCQQMRKNSDYYQLTTEDLDVLWRYLKTEIDDANKREIAESQNEYEITWEAINNKLRSTYQDTLIEQAQGKIDEAARLMILSGCTSPHEFFDAYAENKLDIRKQKKRNSDASDYDSDKTVERLDVVAKQHISKRSFRNFNEMDKHLRDMSLYGGKENKLFKAVHFQFPWKVVDSKLLFIEICQKAKKAFTFFTNEKDKKLRETSCEITYNDFKAVFGQQFAYTPKGIEELRNIYLNEEKAKRIKIEIQLKQEFLDALLNSNSFVNEERENSTSKILHLISTYHWLPTPSVFLKILMNPQNINEPGDYVLNREDYEGDFLLKSSSKPSNWALFKRIRNILLCFKEIAKVFETKFILDESSFEETMKSVANYIITRLIVVGYQVQEFQDCCVTLMSIINIAESGDQKAFLTKGYQVGQGQKLWVSLNAHVQKMLRNEIYKIGHEDSKPNSQLADVLQKVLKDVTKQFYMDWFQKDNKGNSVVARTFLNNQNIICDSKLMAEFFISRLYHDKHMDVLFSDLTINTQIIDLLMQSLRQSAKGLHAQNEAQRNLNTFASLYNLFFYISMFLGLTFMKSYQEFQVEIQYANNEDRERRVNEVKDQFIYYFDEIVRTLVNEDDPNIIMMRENLLAWYQIIRSFVIDDQFDAENVAHMSYNGPIHDVVYNFLLPEYEQKVNIANKTKESPEEQEKWRNKYSFRLPDDRYIPKYQAAVVESPEFQMVPYQVNIRNNINSLLAKFFAKHSSNNDGTLTKFMNLGNQNRMKGIIDVNPTKLIIDGRQGIHPDYEYVVTLTLNTGSMTSEPNYPQQQPNRFSQEICMDLHSSFEIKTSEEPLTIEVVLSQLILDAEPEQVARGNLTFQNDIFETKNKQVHKIAFQYKQVKCELELNLKYFEYEELEDTPMIVQATQNLQKYTDSGDMSYRSTNSDNDLASIYLGPDFEECTNGLNDMIQLYGNQSFGCQMILTALLDKGWFLHTSGSRKSWMTTEYLLKTVNKIRDLARRAKQRFSLSKSHSRDQTIFEVIQWLKDMIFVLGNEQKYTAASQEVLSVILGHCSEPQEYDDDGNYLDGMDRSEKYFVYLAELLLEIDPVVQDVAFRVLKRLVKQENSHRLVYPVMAKKLLERHSNWQKDLNADKFNSQIVKQLKKLSLRIGGQFYIHGCPDFEAKANPSLFECFSLLTFAMVYQFTIQKHRVEGDLTIAEYSDLLHFYFDECPTRGVKEQMICGLVGLDQSRLKDFKKCAELLQQEGSVLLKQRGDKLLAFTQRCCNNVNQMLENQGQIRRIGLKMSKFGKSSKQAFADIEHGPGSTHSAFLDKNRKPTVGKSEVEFVLKMIDKDGIFPRDLATANFNKPGGTPMEYEYFMEVFGEYFKESDKQQREKEEEQLREWEELENKQRQQAIDKANKVRDHLFEKMAQCFKDNQIDSVSDAYMYLITPDNYSNYAFESTTGFSININSFQKMWTKLNFDYPKRKKLHEEEQYAESAKNEMFIDYFDPRDAGEREDYTDIIKYGQFYECMSKFLKPDKCAAQRGIMRIKVKHYKHSKELSAHRKFILSVKVTSRDGQEIASGTFEKPGQVVKDSEGWGKGELDQLIDFEGDVLSLSVTKIQEKAEVQFKINEVDDDTGLAIGVYELEWDPFEIDEETKSVQKFEIVEMTKVKGGRKDCSLLIKIDYSGQETLEALEERVKREMEVSKARVQVLGKLQAFMIKKNKEKAAVVRVTPEEMMVDKIAKFFLMKGKGLEASFEWFMGEHDHHSHDDSDDTEEEELIDQFNFAQGLKTMKLIHTNQWSLEDQGVMEKTYKLIANPKNPAKGISIKEYTAVFEKFFGTKQQVTTEADIESSLAEFATYFLNIGGDLTFAFNNTKEPTAETISKKSWDNKVDEIGKILGDHFNKYLMKNHFKELDLNKDNKIDESEFKEAFGKYFETTDLLEEILQDGRRRKDAALEAPKETAVQEEEIKEAPPIPAATDGVLHVRTRKFVYSEELTKACTYQVRFELRNATTGEILEKSISEPFISKNELNACVLECACTKAFRISKEDHHIKKNLYLKIMRTFKSKEQEEIAIGVINLERMNITQKAFQKFTFKMRKASDPEIMCNLQLAIMYKVDLKVRPMTAAQISNLLMK